MGTTAWARDALALLTGRPGVHRAGLGLAEGGGRRLRFTATDRSDGAAEWCLVDAYEDLPLNTAIRTGRPVLGPLSELRHGFASFVEQQQGTPTTALAAVPLVNGGRILGGFVLFFDAIQSFAPADRRELLAAGEALGAALHRAQRDESRPRVELASEPTPSGATAATVRVSADPAAVSEARHFLRQTLQGWHVDEQVADTAVLCLSELVTNALIHADAGCAVRALLDEDVLTVTVRNSGDQVAVPDQHDDPLRVHGRGLQLVEALAARWGSDLDSAGTTVWFDLDLQAG